jgi:acyl carrier protein
MNQSEALELVLTSVTEVMDRDGVPLPSDLKGETRLFGPQSALDSLGLVNVLLEVEQAVAERIGVTITLASEEALSRSKSPFRTAGTLAEYLVSLLNERHSEGE